MAKGGGAKDKAAREDAARAAADARYEKWKLTLPVLYDSFTNHNLVWPSLSCRWGPRVEDYTYKVKQRAYLSEQTDGSVPNTLVVAHVEVPRPHVAEAESMQTFNYSARSPLVKKFKTIIHPGEVNRIREYPEAQNIVATHSDSPKVFVWNVDSQPERKEDAKHLSSIASTPDLELTGHHQFAEFALAFHPKQPRLISGGRDGEVLLWQLDDQMTSLSTSAAQNDASLGDANAAGRKSVNSGGLGGLDGDPPASATELRERGRFQGHTDTIEDVVFRPSVPEEFCSVGDDKALIFWDARQEGGKPAAKVTSAHSDDIHTVDWSSHDEHLVLTGSADSNVRLFDRRKLQSSGKAAAIHTFAAHTQPILSVQWCPHRAGVFASGGEDHLVMVWDAARVGGAEQNGSARKKPELFFQHAGHRDKVVDFQWNLHDPWTILSVSDDINYAEGGGSLQIWRMNDLVYLPEEEALGELKRHRDYILGKTNTIPNKGPETTQNDEADADTKTPMEEESKKAEEPEATAAVEPTDTPQSDAVSEAPQEGTNAATPMAVSETPEEEKAALAPEEQDKGQVEGSAGDEKGPLAEDEVQREGGGNEVQKEGGLEGGATPMDEGEGVLAAESGERKDGPSDKMKEDKEGPSDEMKEDKAGPIDEAKDGEGPQERAEVVQDEPGDAVTGGDVEMTEA